MLGHNATVSAWCLAPQVPGTRDASASPNGSRGSDPFGVRPQHHRRRLGHQRHGRLERGCARVLGAELAAREPAVDRLAEDRCLPERERLEPAERPDLAAAPLDVALDELRLRREARRAPSPATRRAGSARRPAPRTSRAGSRGRRAGRRSLPSPSRARPGRGRAGSARPSGCRGGSRRGRPCREAARAARRRAGCPPRRRPGSRASR